MTLLNARSKLNFLIKGISMREGSGKKVLSKCLTLLNARSSLNFIIKGVVIE